jgi:hypothetical protein
MESTNFTDQFPALMPPPKRIRGDSQDQATLLREIELLKEVVSHLTKEVSSLKTQLGLQQHPLSFKEALSAQSSSEPLQDGPPKSSEAAPKVSEAAPKATQEVPKETGWTQVKSKNKKTAEKKKVSPPPAKPLKESLDRATSPEEKLKILLRPRRDPVDRTTSVVTMMVKLPLSRQAQQQPMLAWKHTLETLTGHRPLWISLCHPGRGEVFYDGAVGTEVKTILHNAGYLIEDTPAALSEKDLGRRVQVYLNGYFLLLRRVALTGFSHEMQLKLLDMAEASLKISTDPVRKKQGLYEVRKDREWVENAIDWESSVREVNDE